MPFSQLFSKGRACFQSLSGYVEEPYLEPDSLQVEEDKIAQKGGFVNARSG
jgi:hypothetical protein